MVPRALEHEILEELQVDALERTQGLRARDEKAAIASRGVLCQERDQLLHSEC